MTVAVCSGIRHGLGSCTSRCRVLCQNIIVFFSHQYYSYYQCIPRIVCKVDLLVIFHVACANGHTSENPGSPPRLVGSAHFIVELLDWNLKLEGGDKEILIIHNLEAKSCRLTSANRSVHTWCTLCTPGAHCAHHVHTVNTGWGPRGITSDLFWVFLFPII